jgi:hypothetical protein
MNPALWRFALLAVALLFVSISCGRDGSNPLPLVGFKVEFGEQNIPTQMVAGQRVTADVTVKNVSSRIWPSKPNSDGENAVHLSYHWLDRKESMVVFDGLRTPLPRDLGPGESVRLNATVQAPDRRGRYILEVTLVQEGVAWFPERDGDKLTIPVNVISPEAETVRDSERVSEGPEPTKRKGRR